MKKDIEVQIKHVRKDKDKLSFNYSIRMDNCLCVNNYKGKNINITSEDDYIKLTVLDYFSK